MNLQTVIFIGRSGAGKGMQSEMLQKYLNDRTPDVSVLYIETGDYFRKYIQEKGDTWERARKIMETGGRQPDFLAIWMWATAFIEKFSGNQHLVFDGAPRSLQEAKILDTALPFYGRTKPSVVFLNVSQEWAEERLEGRGRADDLSHDVVARRQAYYVKDVTPAVQYYREESTCSFLEVNGEQTPEEVRADILKGLGFK